MTTVYRYKVKLNNINLLTKCSYILSNEEQEVLTNLNNDCMSGWQPVQSGWKKNWNPVKGGSCLYDLVRNLKMNQPTYFLYFSQCFPCGHSSGSYTMASHHTDMTWIPDDFKLDWLPTAKHLCDTVPSNTSPYSQSYVRGFILMWHLVGFRVNLFSVTQILLNCNCVVDYTDTDTLSLSSSLCVQFSWGPPNLISDAYRGPFPGSKVQPWRDANHLPHLEPMSLMNRNYTSSPS